jgi:molybdopterin-containing oxidoreductase family molybdopterin binding subunit
VKAPERFDLLDLCPIAPYGGPFFTEAVLHPETFKLPYFPEMLIVCRSNLLMTCANAEVMAEALKKIPYVVAFATELSETAEFADLLLPDTHYLERLDAIPNEPTEFVGAGAGSWYWMIRQPVVEPMGEARNWVAVLFELADRAGFRGDLYTLLNGTLELKEPFAYRTDEKYTWDQLADRWMKSWFGADRGLDWFKENGFLITGEKKIEEAYPRPFITPRLPIYVEYFIDAGNEVRKTADRLGIPWDTSDYQPLVAWKPCEAFEVKDEHDLTIVNFKLPFHSLSYTTHNAFLAGLSEANPYAYSVLINAETARKKGIKDGDRIRLDSAEGYQAVGQAMLTECIHPEVVGTAGCFGRKSKGLKLSHGKGVHFNNFLPHKLERIDALSAALDSCVRVKITKL